MHNRDGVYENFYQNKNHFRININERQVSHFMIRLRIMGGTDLKIREGYTLRSIVNSWIVIPTGSNLADFTEMLKLNDSGALIWKKLESDVEKDDLVSMLMSEYGIDQATASVDVEDILNIFKGKGLIIE